jgi:transaldolase
VHCELKKGVVLAMKIWLDTAEVKQVEEFSATGAIAGVTTNPTLIARSGRDFRTVVKEMCDLVPGPVSAEVTGENYQEMVREAGDLVEIAKNIVIKIPMTLEGLKATKILAAEKIKVNATLIFSVEQALLAARAGAAFASIFVGRLDDVGAPGLAVVEEASIVMGNFDLDCEIVAASIRSAKSAGGAALAGADIATIPPDVFKAMLAHPLTDKGLDIFRADWEKHLASLA